jgi:glycosyltransferase involved in cell wall biosynthesis
MVSKPRIYVVISTFFPLVGGAETQTLAQCQRLRERGYETTIITFRHKHAWLPQELVGGVPVIRVAGMLLGNREKWSRLVQRLSYLVAMLVMSWLLWRHRKYYDILQVCQFSLLVLPITLVCRLTRKPMNIVVISAGAGKPTKSQNKATLIAGPLDTSTPWLQVDGQTWIDGDLYELEHTGKPVTRFIRSQLQRIGAAVVVLSLRMQGYLVAHEFHLPGTQLIPNGVDIIRFQPAPASLPTTERSQTVVCVSKLRWEKGIDVLLQAWHLVHKQLSEARLILVGSGPIQTQLEKMANALGIADSVEFAGLQSNVPAQLHRGTLAVLPSRWEGMPNALLEAMASGLACVATRVSGSEDLIEHGVNGLLVEPEDYEGMAQALLTLLRDPAIAQKYGQAARLTVERYYSLEHITDMYIELYDKLIDRSQQKDNKEVQLISTGRATTSGTTPQS